MINLNYIYIKRKGKKMQKISNLRYALELSDRNASTSL